MAMHESNYQCQQNTHHTLTSELQNPMHWYSNVQYKPEIILLSERTVCTHCTRPEVQCFVCFKVKISDLTEQIGENGEDQ